ncbi:MAG: hypothetical protein KHZ58_20320 [Hungatella hathewayi]|nr:hypothetical protein [Hungatella hathewayi]
MRKTKKMAALALTIAMAAGGMTSAYAAGATGETSVEASKDVKSAGDTSMLLTGTIKVTTLSVTIPTTVSFNVDMTQVPKSGAKDKTGETKVNVQVEQPEDTIYKITNNSASSVWVYVTGVTSEANGGSKLPVLTDTYADVKANDYNMLFAIKDSAEDAPEAGTYSDPATEPDEIGTAAYWMTKNGINSTDKKYYLNSTTNGELIAKDQAVKDGNTKNEMPLTIYAFTRKGWKAGDKFNVTPVFTVSVTDPTA